MNSKIKIIKHRVNTLDELLSIKDLSLGCEIDVRSNPSRDKAFYLAHDPWTSGEDFSAWIKKYSEKKMSGPLVINTKEDGLEKVLIEELENNNIKDYFFLDTTIPTLVKWTIKEGKRDFSVRLSKYESLETLLSFKGLVNWIWLDCFDAMPIGYVENLKEQMKAKVCLVSPELQGGSLDNIKEFLKWAKDADAICTKHPDIWNQILAN